MKNNDMERHMPLSLSTLALSLGEEAWMGGEV
jgi:hypothetical protein